MLPMPGGMPQRLIREGSLIVRAQDSALMCGGADRRAQRTVAIQALTQTITHFTQGGRFRQAADREKEIAQIYLQEQHDLQRACESFERAGDWYAQEDAIAFVFPHLSHTQLFTQ